MASSERRAPVSTRRLIERQGLIELQVQRERLHVYRAYVSESASSAALACESDPRLHPCWEQLNLRTVSAAAPVGRGIAVQPQARGPPGLTSASVAPRDCFIPSYRCRRPLTRWASGVSVRSLCQLPFLVQEAAEGRGGAQGIYDKRQRLEVEMSKREQELKQLQGWRSTVQSLLERFQELDAAAAAAAAEQAAAAQAHPGEFPVLRLAFWGHRTSPGSK